MDLRPSIVKTLDFLISENTFTIAEDKKVKKLEAWHMCLADLTDDQIALGLVEALKDNKGFLLSSGQFRTICLDAYRELRSQQIEQQKVIEYNQERDNGGEKITFSEWLKRNPSRVPAADKTKETQSS